MYLGVRAGIGEMGEYRVASVYVAINIDIVGRIPTLS